MKDERLKTAIRGASEAGRQLWRGGWTALATLGGMFFPPYCAGCSASVPADQWLCEDCAGAVEPIRAPFCDQCSLPFYGAFSAGKSGFVCANCRGRQFAFQCAVAHRPLRGLVRDLVWRFKYRGEYSLRRPLSGWLLDSLDDERLRHPPVDALVPVPLHPRRLRERGFNQAAVLAALAGRQKGLPMITDALQRVRYTSQQAQMGDAGERMENIRGAFAVRGRDGRSRVQGQQLLLVDDVFTTGATVNECARALLNAGAAGVRVAAVARQC